MGLTPEEFVRLSLKAFAKRRILLQLGGLNEWEKALWVIFTHLITHNLQLRKITGGLGQGTT